MRDRVRNEICAIRPATAIELEHWREAIAWLDSGAPIFRTARPATPPMHLVSYFALIDDGHILLVDHRNAQRWLPTGGHVELGEDPRLTVIRELREELGIEVAVEKIDSPLMVTVTETVGLTSGHTDVSLWYAIRGDRSAPIAFDRDEFCDAKWFPFANLPLDRCDPHLGRFVDKLKIRGL